MSKRPCIHRAEWRLLRGKAAQPLPAHYRLDCDYATPLVAIYREGEGENPLYLCAQHAAAERAAAMDRNAVVALPTNDDSACDVTAPPPENHVAADSAGPQLVDALQSARRGEQTLLTREAPTQSAETPALKPELSTPKPAAPPADTIPVAADSIASASGPVAAEPCASAPPPKPSAPAPKLSAPALKPTAPSAPNETAAASKPTIAVPKANASISNAAAIPAAKPAAQKTTSSAKTPARDLAYGNPAKALVDETIWNLQPGDYVAYRTALRQRKSPLDAAQAAGGQLAVIHRKIHEYTAKVESLLSASNAALNASELVQSIHSVLDRETLTIISDDAVADDQKDAAVARLGEFQEWINHSLNAGSTALDAHRLAVASGDRANWGAASSVSDELARVYRLVYTSARDAVRAAVPEVRDADERLANLYAAKSDIDAAFQAEISSPADLSMARSAVASVPQHKVAEM
jgi:hypothetical protein